MTTNQTPPQDGEARAELIARIIAKTAWYRKDTPDDGYPWKQGRAESLEKARAILSALAAAPVHPNAQTDGEGLAPSDVICALADYACEPCMNMPARTLVDPLEVWIGEAHMWVRADGSCAQLDRGRGHFYFEGTDAKAIAFAVNAALPPQGQPKPVEAGQGWIVTSGDGKRFRTWKDGWSDWTEDREQACRYARRQDAEAVHAEDDDAWCIVQYAPTPATTEAGGDQGRSFTVPDDEDGFVAPTVTIGGNVYISQKNGDGNDTPLVVLSRAQALALGQDLVAALASSPL